MTPIRIPLTPEQFDAKAKELALDGIDISGTNGSIEKEGCNLDWAYDGATLIISVLHHPWVVSDGYVESKIRGWFA